VAAVLLLGGAVGSDAFIDNCLMLFKIHKFRFLYSSGMHRKQDAYFILKLYLVVVVVALHLRKDGYSSAAAFPSFGDTTRIGHYCFING
jgi:hypothetical protein